MSSSPSDEVADSNVIDLPVKASTNDTAVKVILVIAALAGIFGGGAWGLDAKTDTAIEKHAERPHVGVASKEDVKEIKSDLKELRGDMTKLDIISNAKLDRILRKLPDPEKK